ncbi:unnamed protein product, partial [Adineta steineri]
VVGGLVAMAAVLITFGLILLANKYRYRPPSALSTRRTSDRPRATGSIISSRANPIFLNDDNNTITSQPRTSSRRSSSTSNATNLRVEQF